MVKNLPAGAQKRVKALKNLQLEFLKHECTFFAEVYQLERKYQEKYQSIADKRKAIIAGEVEPTDAEAQFKSDEESDGEDDELKERLKSMKSLPKYDENVKGEKLISEPCGLILIISIPFRNSGFLVDYLQEHGDHERHGAAAR